MVESWKATEQGQELAIKEKSEFVVKSNAIVNARYTFSLVEQRLFLKMVSLIKTNDTDFQTYKINVRDFIGELGTRSKAEYRAVAEACEGIMSKPFHIYNDLRQAYEYYTLMSKISYLHGEGVVEVEFHRDLRPHFLQLKGNFTKYSLRFALSLRSNYSIRIYELLKQYEVIGQRTFPLEELKGKLGCAEKFDLYGHFKSRVLVAAQKELFEKTDIQFTYQEIKSGRRVEKIKFYIKTNLPPEQEVLVRDGEQQNIFETAVLEEHRKAIGFLFDEVGEKVGGDLLKFYDEGLLSENVLYAKKHFDVSRGTLAAFMLTAIKKDFARYEERKKRADTLRAAREEKLAVIQDKLNRSEFISQGEYELLPTGAQQLLVPDEKHYLSEHQWRYRKATEAELRQMNEDDPGEELHEFTSADDPELFQQL